MVPSLVICYVTTISFDYDNSRLALMSSCHLQVIIEDASHDGVKTIMYNSMRTESMLHFDKLFFVCFMLI